MAEVVNLVKDGSVRITCIDTQIVKRVDNG